MGEFCLGQRNPLHNDRVGDDRSRARHVGVDVRRLCRSRLCRLPSGSFRPRDRLSADKRTEGSGGALRAAPLSESFLSGRALQAAPGSSNRTGAISEALTRRKGAPNTSTRNRLASRPRGKSVESSPALRRSCRTNACRSGSWRQTLGRNRARRRPTLRTGARPGLAPAPRSVGLRSAPRSVAGGRGSRHRFRAPPVRLRQAARTVDRRNPPAPRSSPRP